MGTIFSFCRDDPGYADAIRIETAMGIPVLRHDEKKPGGVAEVLAFFEGKDSEGEPVGLAIAFDASVAGSRRFFLNISVCSRKKKCAERLDVLAFLGIVLV